MNFGVNNLLSVNAVMDLGSGKNAAIASGADSVTSTVIIVFFMVAAIPCNDTTQLQECLVLFNIFRAASVAFYKETSLKVQVILAGLQLCCPSVWLVC